MLLPTLNLPEKSVVTSQAVQRREVKKIVIPEVKLKEKHSYKDFEDFLKKVQRLKLGDWKVTSSISKCILTLDDEKYNIPKFEIYVDISLEFTVRSYGWCLPDNHQIYKQNKCSLRFSTVSSLVLSLNQYMICSGGVFKTLSYYIKATGPPRCSYTLYYPLIGGGFTSAYNAHCCRLLG